MTADADARTDAADGAAGPPREDAILSSREDATVPPHEDASSEPVREDDAFGSPDAPARVRVVPALGADEIAVELAVDADSLAHLAAGEELDADAARELAALLDSYAAAVDE